MLIFKYNLHKTTKIGLCVMHANKTCMLVLVTKKVINKQNST